MSQMRRNGRASLWDIVVLRSPLVQRALRSGWLIGTVRVGWCAEGFGQSAVDGGEVEIALGHASGDGLGAGVACAGQGACGIPSADGSCSRCLPGLWWHHAGPGTAAAPSTTAVELRSVKPLGIFDLRSRTYPLVQINDDTKVVLVGRLPE
jgi:hypothetical protein